MRRVGDSLKAASRAGIPDRGNGLTGRCVPHGAEHARLLPVDAAAGT